MVSLLSLNLVPHKKPYIIMGGGGGGGGGVESMLPDSSGLTLLIASVI